MDGIISWLQEYWGMSIVGGVTIGSVITLAIFTIKFFLSMKKTQTDNSIMLKALNLLLQERQLMVEKSEIDSRVTASIFKSLSYLVVSSKLPMEEKLALNADYVEVKQLVEQASIKTQELAQLKLNELVAQVQEKVAAVGTTVKAAVTDSGAKATSTISSAVTDGGAKTASIISAAVDGATSLIDKYAGTK